MKFNYFNEKERKFGIATIGRGFTGAMSQLLPSFSAFIGKKLLMKPHGKRHYSLIAVQPSQELNLTTSLGQAHINIYGQGKEVVIMSHGWADTSQSFEQMISKLTSQGYLVAAIDHIGHGKSSGKNSHLLSFIETMELLLEHFEQERIPVAGIVGHSMGAIATLNLPKQTLENKKLILISSPIKFFELMFDKVEQFGISRKLLIRVLESVGQQYGRHWQHLHLDNHKIKLDLDVTFIHDEKDRYAPFHDVKHYLHGKETSLITTSGLGHTRILGDTSVINSVSQVLAS